MFSAGPGCPIAGGGWFGEVIRSDAGGLRPALDSGESWAEIVPAGLFAVTGEG